MRVKLCGVTRPADRDVAVAAGADAVGFVSGVPVETPRALSAERAADLVAGLEPFVTSVLVTVPETVGDAIDRQETVGADIVQVHGDLTPGELRRLDAGVAASVIVAVDTDTDVDRYAAAADALLVDSTTESGMGGTGETHDWERTRDLAATVDVPVVLAGGLTPGNVREAIETVDPFAVDVSSGIEHAPGQKEHDAVRSFVARARGGQA